MSGETNLVYLASLESREPSEEEIPGVIFPRVDANVLGFPPARNCFGFAPRRFCASDEERTIFRGQFVYVTLSCPPVPSFIFARRAPV